MLSLHGMARKISESINNTVAEEQKTKAFQHFTASSNLFILILTVVLGVAAFTAIFLYKNRTLQLRITFAALIV